MSWHLAAVPEDGAALQFRVLFVESLQTVAGDLLFVTTVGCGEHSRLHLPFDLGFVENVQQRRLGGRQVHQMRVGQFVTRCRRASRQEIKRLHGEYWGVWR